MPSVYELFGSEFAKGISVFVGDRRELVATELEGTERAAIEKVFRTGLYQLRKAVPRVAADIEPQLDLALKAASVFKEMIPEKKKFSFPCEPGMLGVSWLFPQAIKYVHTPTPDLPAYTSYATNSWNISLTAGTPAYIFGSDANFYKASPAAGRKALILVFQDGVLEIGASAAIQQFRIISEGVTKYSAYSVAPVTEIEVEEEKTVYQYPTPMGAVLAFYDRGIKWSFMPSTTATTTIKLLGLVFYEYDFYPDLKWVPTA